MKHAALLFLAACGGGATETAVRVRVEFEQSLQVKQLRFSGRDGAQRVFGPEVRPDGMSTSVLESGGDLLVLVPDRLDARELECSVEGLDGMRVVGSGTGAVRVELGREVECIAVLRAGPAAPQCTGCLDPMGKCKTGNDDKQCGSGGAACVDCKGELDHCFAGRCVD